MCNGATVIKRLNWDSIRSKLRCPTEGHYMIPSHNIDIKTITNKIKMMQ